MAACVVSVTFVNLLEGFYDAMQGAEHGLETFDGVVSHVADAEGGLLERLLSATELVTFGTHSLEDFRTLLRADAGHGRRENPRPRQQRDREARGLRARHPRGADLHHGAVPREARRERLALDLAELKV